MWYYFVLVASYVLLLCSYMQVQHWPACLEGRETSEGEGTSGQGH